MTLHVLRLVAGATLVLFVEGAPPYAHQRDALRRAIDDHWKRLEAVRKAAEAWRRKGVE